MARSTRLVVLIKKIYTLWGQKRLLYLLHTFTLKVTGIKTHRIGRLDVRLSFRITYV